MIARGSLQYSVKVIFLDHMTTSFSKTTGSIFTMKFELSFCEETWSHMVKILFRSAYVESGSVMWDTTQQVSASALKLFKKHVLSGVYIDNKSMVIWLHRS